MAEPTAEDIAYITPTPTDLEVDLWSACHAVQRFKHFFERYEGLPASGRGITEFVARVPEIIQAACRRAIFAEHATHQAERERDALCEEVQRLRVAAKPFVDLYMSLKFREDYADGSHDRVTLHPSIETGNLRRLVDALRGSPEVEDRP